MSSEQEKAKTKPGWIVWREQIDAWEVTVEQPMEAGKPVEKSEATVRVRAGNLEAEPLLEFTSHEEARDLGGALMSAADALEEEQER